MKKLSKKKLIELLNMKSGYTYDELAKKTGYHPKSLIRIHRLIKQGKYPISESDKSATHNSIILDYLKSDCKTYKEFYNSDLFTYEFSYPTLCNILRGAKSNDEIVLIRKIKNKDARHFEIVDYASKTLLFTYDSLKNDIKSLKNIIYLLLKTHGCPANISFVNFFADIPPKILNLLKKYDIHILNFKSSYRECFEDLSQKNHIIYSQKPISKEDFYNSLTRKTIAVNTIQFDNTRYKIETNTLIKRNTTTTLYYDSSKTDLFIKYDDETCKLIPIKELDSKKGTSKYC